MRGLNIINKKWLPATIVFILSVTALNYIFNDPSGGKEENSLPIAAELKMLRLKNPIDYQHSVKPILDKRCVVCHGCYDAPCQLKLSSQEGMQRGASDKKIYDTKRIVTMPPTRLFIDKKNTAQWRSFGFTSVLNEGEKSAEENLRGSVLYQLLRLKQQHPLPETEKLPESFTLGLDREQTCPTIDSVDKYSRDHALWGMPYAMPNLQQKEYRTLVSWLARGAPVPALPGSSSAVLPQIKEWEDFLNQPGNKQRLISRYLYEHLFHAHIHFADSPAREFYRLVRSTTATGQAIDEIPTIRPYDDPGTEQFYYRLLKYTPTIVVKNHIVYEFSEQRMQRYRELFVEPEYSVSKLPSYQTEVATNPFKVFSSIPIKSRYRFLLDDAHFFIEGFIKGPVCRGQVALNVIEDQFWVMFFDPEVDVFTNDAQFISKFADDLQIPTDRPDSLDLLDIWTDYWKRQRRYMKGKQSLFEKVGTHDIQHAMNYIWDGEGKNPNSALTVFRHFDSGSVVYGLVGENPETTWVLDYPLFERIHYLLVGGFNVYGNIVHQLDTRIYMDFLRMEGEDNFLAFLPASHRREIRDSWYDGQRKSIEDLFSAPEAWLDIESVTGYSTDKPQQELYQLIKSRLASPAKNANDLNHCGHSDCNRLVTTERSSHIDNAINAIAQLQGRNLHAFPDVAFIRIKMENPQQDIAYSLIRNKAYKNVTSFLADERERDRSDIDHDTLTVVKWLEGSYPNFFFTVDYSDIENFASVCASIKNHRDYEKFVDRYGVRRTNPDFWKMADWFQDEIRHKKPQLSGLFDLSRYRNH